MSDDAAAIQWPEEAPTPACNLVDLTRAHWESLRDSYEKLARRLGLPEIQSPRLSVDTGSTSTYQEVRDGRRRMSWCPSNVDLLSNIFPMLLRRRIAMSLPTKIPNRNFILELMATRKKSWMLWSEKPKRESLAHGQSGIMRSAPIPSAIQLVYLIVWSISMIEDGKIQPSAAYPFGSTSMHELLYVRSSTMDEEGATVIGVAYLPKRAIFFEAFRADEPPPNLVTPDILLL